MASCARIEQSIQSFIDGEQSASERVIFEKHINDCPTCRAILEAQRRCTAELFEVYSPDRMRNSITPYVIEHLPEMIDLHGGQRDLAQVNQRAKHPRPWREYSIRLVPIAAMCVLVFLGYTLADNWPDPVMPEDTLGMVTQTSGMGFQIKDESDARIATSIKDFVLPGDRFETESDSQMLLTLLGPTQVRLAPNTRVLIHSDRRISVEKGSAYLDVAKADQMFRVITPVSNVTVFGTAFDVNVTTDSTTVAVREGEVQVESGELFTQLTPGEEVEVTTDTRSLKPYNVALGDIAPWARTITPDVEALQLFTAKVAPITSNSLIQADNAYFFTQLKGSRIGYVELEWRSPRKSLPPMGYQVYVFRSDDSLLFKGVISSDRLKSHTSARIYNRTSPDARPEFAYVKVVPNYETGQGETKFTNIRAGLVQ